MWRLVRYYHQEDTSESTDPQLTFIALTWNHVISDGIAGQALLNAVLSDTPTESMKGTPSGLSVSSEFPPPMEATLNCRPSLGFLAHQVRYELIVPSPPWAIQRVLEKKPCWPAVPPRQAEDVEEHDR